MEKVCNKSNDEHFAKAKEVLADLMKDEYSAYDVLYFIADLVALSGSCLEEENKFMTIYYAITKAQYHENKHKLTQEQRDFVEARD